MEVPGLSLLAGQAPDVARRLEDFARRLLTSLDAHWWAADQVRTLVEAHARGNLLEELVSLVQTEAGTGEAWAVLWSGDPTRGTVSFHAIAGRGHTPPDAEALSRTLLATVARRGRAVWLEDGDTAVEAAASIVASDIRPHGAAPIGKRGAMYLAGTFDARSISLRARLRIEALCRLAGGFAEATPEPDPTPVLLPGLIGASRPMQDLARKVHGFAAVPWPVLILGETGTGKELVARALHDLSSRSSGPFVAVNCAAIPDELAESTLFGHERGAFTGADRRREGLVERASGGTLFLDEVGELSPRVQAKLLRLLQEQRYERVGGERELRFEGRIVAATLRTLSSSQKDFRADLYHRLGVCVVRVPPLRDRRPDIRPLARFLVERALSELGPGAPALTVSEALLAFVEGEPWPGNVRELDNALKAALAGAVANGDRLLGPEHLPGQPRSVEVPSAVAKPTARAGAAPGRFELVGSEGAELLPVELLPATEHLQRVMVRQALADSGGSRPQAATRLGVSRQWLHTLLTRWSGNGDSPG